MCSPVIGNSHYIIYLR